MRPWRSVRIHRSSPSWRFALHSGEVEWLAEQLGEGLLLWAGQEPVDLVHDLLAHSGHGGAKLLLLLLLVSFFLGRIDRAALGTAPLGRRLLALVELPARATHALQDCVDLVDLRLVEPERLLDVGPREGRRPLALKGKLVQPGALPRVEDLRLGVARVDLGLLLIGQLQLVLDRRLPQECGGQVGRIAEEGLTFGVGKLGEFKRRAEQLVVVLALAARLGPWRSAPSPACSCCRRGPGTSPFPDPSAAFPARDCRPVPWSVRMPVSGFPCTERWRRAGH